MLRDPKCFIARDLTLAETNRAQNAHSITSTFKAFLQSDLNSQMVFLTPFGRSLTKEEARIQILDSSTGASLKLTVLNLMEGYGPGRWWLHMSLPMNLPIMESIVEHL